MAKYETLVEKVIRMMVSSKPAGKAKCVVCGTEIALLEATYNIADKNGNTTSTLPTHGRCDKCQSIYLANLRVNKFMTACKHIGNMKLRLTKEQREAIIAACESSFSEQVVGRLTGDVVVATAFDLKRM